MPFLRWPQRTIPVENPVMRAIALLLLGCGVLGCVKDPAMEPAVSDAALSILENTAEGCAWRRVEPLLGRTETMATIPGETCDLISLAWSGDAKRALLGSPKATWLWSGTELTPFTSPPAGAGVSALGFDANGDPEVIVTSLTVPCDRLRLLAGEWKNEPAHEFECAKGNAPRIKDFPRLRPLEFENVTDEELLYRLETTSPWEPPTWLATTADTVMIPANFTREEATAMLKEYRRIRREDPPERVRMMFRADAPRARGHLEWRALRMASGLVVAYRDGALVFETKDRRAFIPDKAIDAATVWLRGDHLLAMESGGMNPRLYDARTGALTWSAPENAAGSFWPKLATPQ